jgi:hypothetical protein
MHRPGRMVLCMNARSWFALVLSSVALAAAALFSAPAEADTRAKMAENLARFQRFAGAPVKEMRHFRLHSWQPLGEQDLAIWANPGDVYWVHVGRPCSGLGFARSITVSSTNRVVMTRFDYIAFDHQRCRIEEIRPVDYKAVRQAWRAEREAKEK